MALHGAYVVNLRGRNQFFSQPQIFGGAATKMEAGIKPISLNGKDRESLLCQY